VLRDHWKIARTDSVQRENGPGFLLMNQRRCGTINHLAAAWKDTLLKDLTGKHLQALVAARHANEYDK
jgi:hypothetical protein